MWGIEFQFPTGWNSTKNKQGEVQASRGFNSQRDGILLKTSRAKFRQAGVSIPNGMEFY
ncbi:hypothetical protein [uncultured Campylobacter sp.]|uniref:hypothetical protein n=1 Tax=uncultured Campylobacter sp. TaxID=218934 RepID=UPI00261C3260|nr:hypothetical protein [uncultured Campylobacter sp.]